MGRWMGVLMATAALLAALLTGVLAATAGAGPTAPLPPGWHAYPPPVGARERVNRRAAARDAARLLTRVVLPPGATPSAREPAGDGGLLARPGDRPAEVKLLDRHSWWRVPGPLATVSAFVKANAPAGASLLGSGISGGTSEPAGGSEDFGWPPIGHMLGTRMLVIGLVALSRDETGLRVDAEVQWIVPRPVAEQIPRQVRVMNVTVGRPGAEPSTSIMVINRSKVNRIVTMIDDLQIVQPEAINCPAEPAAPPGVTFTFTATVGGPVLALAAEPAGAVEPTTPCDPMTLTIQGRPQIPLLGGAAVVAEAQRLLGVKLSRRPGLMSPAVSGRTASHRRS
jgi:hypothetical protein